MVPEIRVYGVDHCEDTKRTRQHLERLDIPFTYVNLEKDEDADRKVKDWNGGRRITPTVVIAGNSHTLRLVEPANDELDAALQEYGLSPAA